MAVFTEESLPAAVKSLFQANGYSVQGPIHYRGAEVDLVATQLSGFVETKIYIEVTIQYVDVTKYGKDLTKLVLFQGLPGVQRLIISSKGFTVDVRERAEAAGILTMTYDELFRSFEKADPYIQMFLGDSPRASQLRKLDEVYEEPNFEDAFGTNVATDFLTDWYKSDSDRRWLVVVGEYGTGKTALTRVLHRRWLKAYAEGAGTPLPFRIELRDFAKQFDSRGLLHHFLDRNGIGHLPIQFVEAMIAQGRVVLLLDGYDEMAQYLNVRERRACLEALTDLARGGARGIITSRPNYFTEAEELRVFEILYQKLDGKELMGELDRNIIEQEILVDRALDAFILKRLERRLRDLSPAQARRLVERHLAEDSAGAAAVNAVLDRVFKSEDGVGSQSLSGKPVIATYLLEVVEELKQDTGSSDSSILSEWQMYDLILNKLMLRDWKRVPDLLPYERRSFLQRLALYLTESESKILGEEDFRKLVNESFRNKIRQRSVEGTDVAGALFDDLRSSATLTRADDQVQYGWRFSHNTLREFLLVEELLGRLASKDPVQRRVPLTDAMRSFVRSMSESKRREHAGSIAARWHERRAVRGLDQMLSLLWETFDGKGAGISFREELQKVVGEGLDLSSCTLQGLTSNRASNFDLSRANAARSEFVECNFEGMIMSGMNLDGAVFDACIFRSAHLDSAIATNVFMLDCDLTGVNLTGADFRGLDGDSTAYISRQNVVTLVAESLLGYLRHRGATTDYVDEYHVFKFHDDFDIVDKIFRYLLEGTWRQMRGIVQRGPASKNVPFARALVEYLLSDGYVTRKYGKRPVVSATPRGRAAFARFVQDQEIDAGVGQFLEARKK